MNNDLQGLNLLELLDLLEPATDPPAISLMPQTVGWLWLALALAVGLLLLVRRILRQRRANAYRRAGLAALSRAGDDPTRIARVLRRTALAAFPRQDVAGLTGEHWLAFLDQTLSSDAFSNGPGRILAQAPYRKVPDSVPGLRDLAQRWIADHRRTPSPAGHRS